MKRHDDIGGGGESKQGEAAAALKTACGVLWPFVKQCLVWASLKVVKKGRISSFSLTLKGRNRHKNDASIQSVTLTTTKSHRNLNVPPFAIFDVLKLDGSFGFYSLEVLARPKLSFS